MWSILSAIISAIAAFFGARKGNADKEQKESINVSARTSSDITRETQAKTETETHDAEIQANADADRILHADSVQHGADIINEAIRRANGKTNGKL